ncbi:tetrathionate reductase subunit TtrA [Malaciobacter molluscorum]|uniref:molybdopterin-dependent oxidoreductase n=1 Tax=Malaciobacter molluscorum TaxID=1032072 RepID=UPI00100B7E49|nr:molybdopterin-dependent oxidoreductase [Malaciobacter molluscorum]RXJ97405.1 tetrathionate reductase subunit TtrA [Malaciobacter molluscorum]
MNKNRRNFLLGTSAVAATAAVAGYKDTIKTAVTFSKDGKNLKDEIYGNSLTPEGEIRKNFIKNDDFEIRNSVCNGCVTNCGVRVKINRKSNEIVKVTGNPYNPLSTDPWLPYETSIRDSFTILGKDSSFSSLYRSTACSRGNVVFDKAKDPFRVLKPLKRVGKRGENKWKEIEIEQLLEEITEGGNLFNEGHVDGLKAIRDIKTPLNKQHPEFGPKSNQLCILGTGDDGRKAFMVHRFRLSFGTHNYQGHTSTCGLSMRAGEASYLGDFKKYPHLKPDFENCEYLLTIGTSPAQAGNPFKRQAKLLAKARVEKSLKCVTVTPMLTNSDSIAAGDMSQWIPVIPGGDLAFVMGMLQVIINEKLYNKEYLSLPSIQAQKNANDASYSNATHLVIQDKEGFNKILKDKKDALVIDEKTNELKKASEVQNAKLFVDQEVTYNNKTFKVKSAMTLLKESANLYSLDFYEKESGVSKNVIIKTAKEFTSHGRKSAVDCHGGTMHTTGFYTTYAIMMLGAMVGNLNYKGGMSAGGGRYKDFKGSMYNLLGYKGKVKPKGYRIDKTRTAYEKTAEYKNKVKNGQNPYPAKDTWYPLTNALESEIITNSANEYPYKLKALISWNANFMYGQSGSHHLKKLLEDPKKSVPLMIAIDPFINETSKYADYIVPDSIIYETWGVTSAWSGYVTKLNTAKFPTIKPKQATFKNGEPICMDSFMIELGKKLNLPGFGKNAIKGKNKKTYSLDKPEDFYIRAFENIAMDKTPVPDISDEEIKLAALEPYVNTLKRICGKNWRKTAFVMSRGGRFEDKKAGYKDDKLSHPYTKNHVCVFNESLGKTKHSFTGKNFSGVPSFYKQQLANGEAFENLYSKEQFPLAAFSYKSNVLSAPSVSGKRMQHLRYTTYVDLNPISAKKYNLIQGDIVSVNSPNGAIKAMVRLRNGLYPNTIGIEHGLGRDGLGAEDILVNNKKINGIIRRKSGININKLGLLDSSRIFATISDFVVGSNARQAIPVKITKI